MAVARHFRHCQNHARSFEQHWSCKSSTSLASACTDASTEHLLCLRIYLHLRDTIRLVPHPVSTFPFLQSSTDISRSETKGLSLEYMDRLFGSTKEGDIEQAVAGQLDKEQASYIESIPMTNAPKLPAVRE